MLFKQCKITEPYSELENDSINCTCISCSPFNEDDENPRAL